MSTSTRSISDIASDLGIPTELLIPQGRNSAKVDIDLLARPRRRPTDTAGRSILVSAITPTPAGEGKTTTSIGLADALRASGESVCLSLREPSLGPCFGIKGGGTGGGRSSLYPADDINLHFNGDFPAVAAAHNLLAAMLDNHLHFQTSPSVGIDPRRVQWRRVMDMNDRALRNVTVGLGGPADGVPRSSGFDITAASEIMAILCLATDLADLRARLERTVVAIDREGVPVTPETLGATGAMMALLRNAVHPNLVQTLSGAPALVHGGPFANIAHGCSSVAATRLGLHLADWTVTEAGFGFDLGAEKFYDIKCRQAGLNTAACVLVATVRALKLHAGVSKKRLDRPDADAVERGLPNLAKHLENIGHFGQRAVVALNRFADDTEAEIAVVRQHCDAAGIPFAVCTHFADGPSGAAELAELVRAAAAQRDPQTPLQTLYELDAPVREKVRAVATTMYGARGVSFSKLARRDVKDIGRLGLAGLPICIAKTQRSLSDDPTLQGRPTDFDVSVKRVVANAGAGFLVVMTGDIVRMPGLPRRPQAENIDLVDGEIVGLR